MDIPMGIWLPSSQGSNDHMDDILVSFGSTVVLFTRVVSTEIQKCDVSLGYRASKQVEHEICECECAAWCAGGTGASFLSQRQTWDTQQLPHVLPRLSAGKCRQQKPS